MSDEDAALYRRVEQALTRYVELVKEMTEQRDQTEDMLHQGSNMVTQGKALLRRMLELRRQLAEERKSMADFRQAVNRDCQGLRDGLALARSEIGGQLEQQKKQTEELQRELDAAAATVAILIRRTRLLTIALVTVTLAAIILSLF